MAIARWTSGLARARPDEKYTCLAVVNAFHASKEAVVASGSGLEYFSMVATDSPSFWRTGVVI